MQTFLLTPSAPLKSCCSLPSSQSGSFKNQGRSLHVSAQNPSWLPISLIIKSPNLDVALHNLTSFSSPQFPAPAHWPRCCSWNIPNRVPPQGLGICSSPAWSVLSQMSKGSLLMPSRCCSSSISQSGFSALTL